MTFPQTRLTLIERLAAGGDEGDWSEFLRDYWGPICRFAMRYGASNIDQAEEAASDVFEALWKNRLLVRWVSQRTAKLRTLLCVVARNALANRARRAENRHLAMSALSDEIEEWAAAPQDEVDAFYAAWVEELVLQTVHTLLMEYGRQGKVDYVRVLYGRICDRLANEQLSDALGIKRTDVDNYYRHARDRLKQALTQQLRQHVERYVAPPDVGDEFRQEWRRLGEYLAARGGLEEAMRQAYRPFEAISPSGVGNPKLSNAIRRFSGVRPATDA